ncbi:hypothetical protein ACIQOW_01280 [Kitasatospora sp. NPDC091335]|uniref:hypothetical protein n=1 Tax=Kitasatospora sp. NPDC091335 TaxID=3364085 RepID=UPI00381CCA82
MNQDLEQWAQWAQWAALFGGALVALGALVRSAWYGLAGRHGGSPVGGIIAGAVIPAFPWLTFKVLPTVWGSVADAAPAESAPADGGG